MTLIETGSGSIEVVNYTDVADNDLLPVLRSNPLIAALTDWTAATQSQFRNRAGGLFDRDRFMTPATPFAQMRLAAWAVDRDDIVGSVIESTESLAFSKMDFYAEEEDEEDVYNQIAADIDLDARLREMWRELFTVSQFTAAVWWTTKTYKVRGRHFETGVKKKKTYNLRVPKAITIFDPLKIVPVGSTVFNQEQLCYIAGRKEAESILMALENKTLDPLVQRMFMGEYEPDETEWMQLVELGVERSNKLFLLNPTNVFRHTATRPQYQRFASVRMTSVFELLDLKAQLKQMDRAHLIGGTNFIVLVTKGTDQLPARPEEIAHLQAQVRTVGRVPILVGDHRLQVQIVTPNLDKTLDPSRYAMLDARITARLYQMFVVAQGGGAANRSDDSIKLVKVIARGLESRRHMLQRTLERYVFKPMFDQNEILLSKPKLRFHPKSIALDFDSAYATFLLDLRAQNDLSRETILSQFDIDQTDEARMVERERSTTDLIFQTAIPFNSPENTPIPPGGKGGPPMPMIQPAKPPAGAPPAKAPAGPAKAPGADKSAQRRAGRNQGGKPVPPGPGAGKPPINPRKAKPT